jgi:DNA-binding phage protein
MYPPHKEMDELLAKDAERFKNAMLKAGLNPSLKLGGIEIIGALSKQYEKNLDLRQVASEFGLSPESLQKAAGDVGGDAQTLVRRLEQQGYVPRDNLEGTFAGLVPSLSDDDPIFAASPSPEATKVAKVNAGDNKAAGAPGLSVVADRSAYAVNDLPVFTVKTDKECYLTLINVDGSGTGTVIYPNKFQQANVIKAGQNFKFPGADAPFQFRFRDKGTETVIALCNANQGKVDTIAHDFGNKQFTELGNYEKFVTRAIVVEASKKPKKVASADKKIAKIAKRSGIARSAIKIAVK